MRSSIFVFYIALFCLPLAAAAHTAAAAGDPDALYRDRADSRERETARQRSGRRGWRPTRAISNRPGSWRAPMYWLGGSRRRARAACGPRSAASRPAAGASTLEPTRPEGYFWMAADMGALAESFGLRQGLKYRGDDQGCARDRAAARSRRFRRDRRTGRSDAGTSRCPGCSAGARRSRRSTSASRSPTIRTASPRTTSSRRRCSTWTVTPMPARSCARPSPRRSIPTGNPRSASSSSSPPRGWGEEVGGWCWLVVGSWWLVVGGWSLRVPKRRGTCEEGTDEEYQEFVPRIRFSW